MPVFERLFLLLTATHSAYIASSFSCAILIVLVSILMSIPRHVKFFVGAGSLLSLIGRPGSLIGRSQSDVNSCEALCLEDYVVIYVAVKFYTSLCHDKRNCVGQNLKRSRTVRPAERNCKIDVKCIVSFNSKFKCICKIYSEVVKSMSYIYFEQNHVTFSIAYVLHNAINGGEF